MSHPHREQVAASPNFKELHGALKSSLDERGVLNSIRATMRAEIFVSFHLFLLRVGKTDV